jgi:hypothetical protein
MVRYLLIALAVPVGFSLSGCDSIPHPLDCRLGTVAWANCPPGTAGYDEHQRRLAAEHRAWLARPEAGLLIEEKLAEGMKACLGRSQAGELQTHVDRVLCDNAAMTRVYRAAGYPYMDVVYRFEGRALEIASKSDHGQLSDEDARTALAQALLDMQVDASRRAQGLRDSEPRRTESDESKRSAFSARVLDSYAPPHWTSDGKCGGGSTPC